MCVCGTHTQPPGEPDAPRCGAPTTVRRRTSPMWPSPRARRGPTRARRPGAARPRSEVPLPASGSARAGRKSNSKKENEIIMHYNRTNTTRFVRLYRHRYWVHRDARGSVINNSGVTLTLTRSTSAAPAPLCLSASAPIAIRGIFHISISRRHPPTRHGDGDITIARRPPAGAPAWSRQHKWRTRPPAEHDAQHRDRRGISTTCERNR